MKKPLLAAILGVSMIFGIGSTTSAMAAPATSSSSQTAVSVGAVAEINPLDQQALDEVSAARTTYQEALGSYQASNLTKHDKKRAFNKALKAYEKLMKAQARAKRQVSSSFRASVNAAKLQFEIATAAAQSTAAKAEAKAAKNSAIEAASNSRTEALALIGNRPEKPKPAK